MTPEENDKAAQRKAARENKWHRDRQQLKSLDLSCIEFPSDRLTVRDLRRRKPQLFDKGYEPSFLSQPRYLFRAHESGHAEQDLGYMLMMERIVAGWAYAKAKGLHWDSEPEFGVDLVQADLRAKYRDFGIASGNKEAAELIRGIKRQAEELANQKGR